MVLVHLVQSEIILTQNLSNSVLELLLVVEIKGWPQNVSDRHKNEASCSPLQKWIEARKKQDYRNVSIKIVSQNHLIFVT